MEKDDAYIKQVEAEINQIIIELQSRPTRELIKKAQGLLNSVGVNPELLAKLNQEISVATQQVESAKANGIDIVANNADFTPEQLKVIDSFYGSLNPLTKQIKEYKEALDKFELDMKVKEDKLKELNAEIAANPFSKLANAPRARRDSVIMDMIKLSAELEKHHSLCQYRLDVFKAKKIEIENDKTLTPNQLKVLKETAEREISDAEKELKAFRNKLIEYYNKITEHLEKGSRDKIAAEVSSTKEEYEQTVQKSFSDTDKTKIVNFVKDVVNSKDIDKDYELFTENFVYRVARELREPTIENETKTEGTKHQDRVKRNSKYNMKDVESLEQTDSKSKSFAEKEDEKKANKHSKEPQNTK